MNSAAGLPSMRCCCLSLARASIWSFAKKRVMRHHGIPKEKFLCYRKEMEWRYNNREKFIRSFCEIDGRLDRVFSVCYIISKEPLMTQTGSGKP